MILTSNQAEQIKNAVCDREVSYGLSEEIERYQMIKQEFGPPKTLLTPSRTFVFLKILTFLTEFEPFKLIGIVIYLFIYLVKLRRLWL